MDQSMASALVPPIYHDAGLDIPLDTSYPHKIRLFGHPVTHSLSPLLHSTLYKNLDLPWTYTLYESFSLTDFFNMNKTAIDPVDSEYTFDVNGRADHPGRNVPGPLAQEPFLGASTTMPHKITIIPHLDAITPACAAIGACNTIFLRRPPANSPTPKYWSDKILVGTNTDCVGVREALLHGFRHAFPGAEVPKGKNALIIGGGGTTRSSSYALHTYFGANTIYILNRDLAETEAVKAQFMPLGVKIVAVDLAEDELPWVTEGTEAPFWVVGCVPDIPPVSDAEKRVRELSQKILAAPLPTALTNGVSQGKKGVLLDMCYKPRWTTLLQTASASGWECVEGIEAMIEQGVEQVLFWSGRTREECDVDMVAEIIRKADEVGQKKEAEKK
ncbi:hypothetical protein YB2330_006529 [Saitoella coloradoensis]